MVVGNYDRENLDKSAGANDKIRSNLGCESNTKLAHID